MKYIDAEKLIAEIKRRKVILDKFKDSFEAAACCKQELEWIKGFINSLQLEQPETEIKSPFTGGKVAILSIQEEVTFRGEKVKILRKYYRCEDTGIEFTDSKLDDDMMWTAFRAYCEKKGMTSFTDIMLKQEQPIKVYRVENEKEQKGLWRKFDGTWEPLFDMLTDGQCKDMPMGDSPIYREGGKQWFASAPSRETLQKWFSKKDLEELTEKGFTISEFEVVGHKKVSDFEYIFTRDNIISRTYLKVSDIYPQEQSEVDYNIVPLPEERMASYIAYCLGREDDDCNCPTCGKHITGLRLFPYYYDRENNDVYFASICPECGKIIISKE